MASSGTRLGGCGHVDVDVGVMHYRDVYRMYEALRRLPLGEFTPVDEIDRVWDLVQRLETILEINDHD